MFLSRISRNFFSYLKFSYQNWFLQKIRTKLNFFLTKFLLPNYFLLKFFLPKIFLAKTLFLPRICFATFFSHQSHSDRQKQIPQNSEFYKLKKFAKKKNIYVCKLLIIIAYDVILKCNSYSENRHWVSLMKFIPNTYFNYPNFSGNL